MLSVSAWCIIFSDKPQLFCLFIISASIQSHSWPFSGTVVKKETCIFCHVFCQKFLPVKGCFFLPLLPKCFFAGGRLIVGVVSAVLQGLYLNVYKFHHAQPVTHTLQHLSIHSHKLLLKDVRSFDFSLILLFFQNRVHHQHQSGRISETFYESGAGTIRLDSFMNPSLFCAYT